MYSQLLNLFLYICLLHLTAMNLLISLHNSTTATPSKCAVAVQYGAHILHSLGIRLQLTFYCIIIGVLV